MIQCIHFYSYQQQLCSSIFGGVQLIHVKELWNMSTNTRNGGFSWIGKAYSAICAKSCSALGRLRSGAKSLEQTQYTTFVNVLQTFNSFVRTSFFGSDMNFEVNYQSKEALIIKDTNSEVLVTAVYNMFRRDWFHCNADSWRLASSKDSKASTMA